MTSSLGTRIATVGLAGALLLGGSTLGSYAANGGSLLLGHKNTATKTTTLKNKKGTALSLKSKAGTAPFKVSNSTKVTSLNADLVDGLDSTALQNQTYTYSLAGTTTSPIIRFTIPGLPAGKYLASYAVNAAVTGATAFFGCVLDSGTPFANPVLPNLGATSAGAWYVSAAGYIDTTVRTYTLTCQSNGTAMTVGTVGTFPSQVTFTRTDSVTSGSAAGSRGSAGRSTFGG